MPGTRNSFKIRTLLIWAIILLIIPFGYTLEKPFKVIDEFLGK